ncbi:hypothetical protein SUDANB145_00056 [Streptomyces sp. enrichment culture]|uniref:MFS transporter n=1 Tax=Streptomyces sp. enrichment culture TaxID=1795815 RepID=UPI003F57B1D8
MPGGLIALLAVACGMTVANLYYAQPLLSSLSEAFGVGTATTGTLITLTQAGYVVGMLFLVPLGDRLEKRQLVTVLLTVTTVALTVAGLAPGFPVLLVASLVSGATSVVAQILVPFAADLAPDHARGRVVGRVMSGLLTGILLSRTLSSVVSGLAGWRVVFLGSAAGVGVFALVGAAGAAVAPLAGRWADRGLARPATGAALALAALSFAVAGPGGHSVVLLALAAILVDVAVQAALILGRHTVYALDPTARSRLNSAFIAMFLTGGALGSQLGTVVYDAAGWGGLTVLGAALPLPALAYWATERPAPGAGNLPRVRA